MKYTNYFTRSGGFSLLEVLISLSIMSIGVLGMALVSNNVVRSNSFSGNKSDAILLIQDKLEELTYLDFDDPQLTDDADSNDLNNIVTPDHLNTNPVTVYFDADNVQNNPAIDPSGVSGQGDSNYTRFWNVVDTSAALKTIAVSVTWSDMLGDHTVTLTTLKAK